MPVSVYDVGETRLQTYLATLDAEVREAVEVDWGKVKTNPEDPPMPWGPWTIPDLIPEPSRVVVLAGRALCRYVTYDVKPVPKPAIVAIGPLEQGLEPI